MSDGARKIGDTIDALGVRATINDGELVTGVLVILSILGDGERTRVATAWSDGLGWVTRRGLVEISRDAYRIPPIAHEGDEEEGQ